MPGNHLVLNTYFRKFTRLRHGVTRYGMIDACHIVPSSLSKDDRINNGLVLCSCWRELVARVYTFSTRAVRAASSH